MGQLTCNNWWWWTVNTIIIVYIDYTNCYGLNLLWQDSLRESVNYTTTRTIYVSTLLWLQEHSKRANTESSSQLSQNNITNLLYWCHRLSRTQPLDHCHTYQGRECTMNRLAMWTPGYIRITVSVAMICQTPVGPGPLALLIHFFSVPEVIFTVS